MTPFINRLVVAFIGLTIVAGLAGCNQQPKAMTQQDFAENRDAQKANAERAAGRR